MLKVAKFGGSSMADAGQYRKVREIIEADPARRVVIVSAAGKRNKKDHKLTEWHTFCRAIEELPYFKEVCLMEEE